MNIREGICITTRPAPKNMRKSTGYWNWKPLMQMVARCISTGSEQQGSFGGTYYAIVKPEWAIIEEKQTDEYKSTHEKVSICLYNLAHTLSVEQGPTAPCPQEQAKKA